MSDLSIRIEGRAGRITLQRPDVLNALTHKMCLDIEAALDNWQDKVDLIILDALGDKAFCAGGDIAVLYESAQSGDLAYSQRFWRDEYRLNAKIDAYPQPIVSFLQGFTMGGGVGVGCHASHRVVCETSRIAMPECSIGLVPDVGGSLFLAHAPGRLGPYLATTGTRMAAADAIFIGFADHFVPQDQWEALKSRLCQDGDASAVLDAALPPGPSDLDAAQAEINALFASPDLAEVEALLASTDTSRATKALKALRRNGPLAMRSTLVILDRLKDAQDIRDALALEYRYTFRAVEQGDFVEGIRALIIDKDNAPEWAYQTIGDVPQEAVSAMLAPLGPDALDLEADA